MNRKQRKNKVKETKHKQNKVFFLTFHWYEWQGHYICQTCYFSKDMFHFFQVHFQQDILSNIHFYKDHKYTKSCFKCQGDLRNTFSLKKKIDIDLTPPLCRRKLYFSMWYLMNLEKEIQQMIRFVFNHTQNSMRQVRIHASHSTCSFWRSNLTNAIESNFQAAKYVILHRQCWKRILVMTQRSDPCLLPSR